MVAGKVTVDSEYYSQEFNCLKFDSTYQKFESEPIRFLLKYLKQELEVCVYRF